VNEDDCPNLEVSEVPPQFVIYDDEDGDTIGLTVDACSDPDDGQEFISIVQGDDTIDVSFDQAFELVAIINQILRTQVQ